VGGWAALLFLREQRADQRTENREKRAEIREQGGGNRDQGTEIKIMEIEG
jgi:hypothetical protein